MQEAVATADAATSSHIARRETWASCSLPECVGERGLVTIAPVHIRSHPSAPEAPCGSRRRGRAGGVSDQQRAVEHHVLAVCLCTPERDVRHVTVPLALELGRLCGRVHAPLGDSLKLIEGRRVTLRVRKAAKEALHFERDAPTRARSEVAGLSLSLASM
eukprot:CAMPEP_0181175854 /NCGR_PEP_ID=MMETSP1096-20121128/4306_1 /TAXON_ID=156174 ORGANISM="Chrysochromulina ericina, Strain CCMP281" /NCGR_SAMPLE_ID=MMETSP1096 /ASSEMBLY_ACC=CAM_ASM_000453 /LENGTH=159 /DNA_ID=CAMNT_0023263879 /DNA_START=384 /DNA_END=864 /DNA_ORIENTATION=-